MLRPMNNVITQVASVGVIALVTIFPSPERLKDAILLPRDRVIMTHNESSYVLIDSVAYNGEVISLTAPFPLACVGENNAHVALGSCAQQLWFFIEGNGVKSQTALPPSSSTEGPLGPQVEQARRSLIEICRLRWSMTRAPEDLTTDEICSTLL